MMRKQKKRKASPQQQDHRVESVVMMKPARSVIVQCSIPTHYHPDYHPIQLEKLLLLGMDDKQCAFFFGVSHAVFKGWVNTYPEFQEIMRVTRERHDADVVHSLYMRAKGFAVTTEQLFCTKDGDIIRAQTERYYPPDVAAAQYLLRTRRAEEWNKAFGAPDDPLPPGPLNITMNLNASLKGEDRSYRKNWDLDLQADKSAVAATEAANEEGK